MNPESIPMQEYDYALPEANIAQQAVEPRDSAKLLVWKNREITDSIFSNIAEFLPAGAGLFYNDAKVIPARILLKKESGASVELFLIKPYASDYFTALNSTFSCRWECMAGNKKKWRDGETMQTEIPFNDNPVSLKIEWVNREQNIVMLHWEHPVKFIELLEKIGQMPLPPYIKRAAVANDRKRYQTVYSMTDGSVAAPTAGLHFTEKVMNDLKSSGHSMTALTLHVSAGTFLPVTVQNALDHNMHQEIFTFSRSMLMALKETGYIVAVGTTSVRVLESLYWCAMKLQYKVNDPFIIHKLEPYECGYNLISNKEAIDLLLQYMEDHKTESITGATSIMIFPGYEFRFVKGLITNFHQPKSTLLLLIAAFIGDAWKTAYTHALKNNYRFLSYGDSSILLR